MTALEKAVLEENIPYLRACETLDEVDKGNVNLHPDALYDAALLATDSETVANAYRVSAVRARQRPAAAEG